VVVPLAPQEWPEPSPWQPGGGPLGYNATFTQPAAPAADAGATTAGPEAAVGAAPGAPGAPQGAVPPPGPVLPGGDWRWQGRQDRWQSRAERWQRKAERREQRGERHGSGGIVFGALLIVIGGLIAWHEYDPRLDLSLAWPVAVIAFGIFLVASSVGWRRGK